MTRAIVATVLLLISTMLDAQTLPFPQNADYPYGIMPTNRSHVDAQAAYDHWKSHFVTADGAGGFRRVFYDDPWKPSESEWTVSEGVAYGMLLAVNLADRALFDDLWRYTKLHQNAHGLMHWKVRADGVAQHTDSASDADEDMAFALLCADLQWGSGGAINYRQDAITLIGNIFQYEVDPVTFAFKPGDAWGSRSTVNPSYLVPAYYRIFSQATDDARWLSVASKSYEILGLAAHPATGLLPEWCLPNGQPDPQEGPEGDDYRYNAARTPWRLALDYVWFEVEEARTLTQDLTAFASGVGAAGIKDGYLLDGTLVGANHNSAFVGPFAAGSMASSDQAFSNAAYQETVNLSDNLYYNSSLRALTLLLMTGNFLNPCPTCGPNPPPPASPSWLRTTAASTSRIDLQWDDNSNNETGFKIERKQGCCGPWTQVAIVVANTETWGNTGLQCGTTYAYRVWAYNGAGDSSKTNEAAATTSTCSVPACPTWLRTTTASSSQINLEWDDNSNNEDGFKVERKQGCCGPWTLVATLGSNVETWNNTSLACATTYAYRVWAFNTAGSSCKTNEAGTTTSSCP
jgi:endo-1,4-beta-D-glucanase Y